ncbi:L-threonine kinase [Caloramator mitchellensis]|uniref:L-threonine kinase n=1 Tax=Caloramator mitchellensis TaxID=908809 RepID=A0A0R3JZE0_CALMK|nr:hypothetical protein [Caloramator mitchellensis]KRQ85922.1 L-threonine kinase [Caloramator mitchellensis]
MYECKYPGSVGEILQGKVNGIDILVSFPINIYTKVKIIKENKENNYYKSRKFLENLLNKWGIEEKLGFEIHSNIPKEKGFASSTADLCALYHCILNYFGRKYNIEELIEETIKIEPTDSIIFKRATAFDYKNGLFFEEIGDYFEFDVLVFEGREGVDTIKFNNEVKNDLSKVDDLYQILKEAVTKRDLKYLAEVSTSSIIRNQQRLRYNILDDVLNIMKKTDGLGIIGAHSGNMLGIIYDKKREVEFEIAGYKKYWVKTLEKITEGD